MADIKKIIKDLAGNFSKDNEAQEYVVPGQEADVGLAKLVQAYRNNL